MKRIVAFVEETSAKVFLDTLVPRLGLAEVHFQCRKFEGVDDLISSIVDELRKWRTPDTSFLVLCDQDSHDCHTLKQRLRDRCDESGREVLIRIACHELESFFLGDLAAVEQGLNITGLAKLQEKELYRSPDRLGNAAQVLEKLIERPYSKIAGSRSISPHLSLDPAANRSHSFRQLVTGLQRLAS